MNFYGREKQKKQIHKMLETEDQMVTLIYGRRRIGKSETDQTVPEGIRDQEHLL